MVVVRLRWMLLLVVPVGALLAVATAQDTPQPPNRAAFMRTKLVHAQKVLEGIAKENYDEVAKHSEAISLLTMEEQWNVLTTEPYLKQSRAFRDAADAITDAAKARNVDAMSLAYVDMTLSCVKCHKQLRTKAKPASK